jgi:hypothetical protein
MLTYGDRTDFYVYSNVSLQSRVILSDLDVISREYRFVVLILPLDDSAFFYYNLRVFDSWAAAKNLKVLYAFFPKSKYGPEPTYVDPGSRVNKRLVHDMLYLNNLTSTAEIVVWYGWKGDPLNVTSIQNFYDSLPPSLKGKYGIWLDGSFVADAAKAGLAGFVNPRNIAVVTELYSQGSLSQLAYAFRNQIVVSGVSGATTTGDWREEMALKLDSVNVPSNYTQYDPRRLAVWIFWDRNDGSGERYSAYISGALDNPLIAPIPTAIVLDQTSPSQRVEESVNASFSYHLSSSNTFNGTNILLYGNAYAPLLTLAVTAFIVVGHYKQTLVAQQRRG